jgi:leucyl aminopeptidase
MNISVSDPSSFSSSADALVLALLPGEKLTDSLKSLNIQADDFISRFDELSGPEQSLPATLVYPSQDSRFRWMIAARSSKSDVSEAEMLRRLGGSICPELKKHRVKSLAIMGASCEYLAEGIVFGQYEFSKFKSASKDSPAPVFVELCILLSDDNALAERANTLMLVAENANWARDLANTPGCFMTPTHLAAEAEKMALDFHLDCEVLEESDMKRVGLNAILAVSAGSAQPAKLIILKRMVNKKKPTVALVGKGLTFDAGGISIKPGNGMHEMKFDMCGAAAMLGAMRSISMIQPDINVICAIPSSENLLGASALKPGDVIKAYNGKTIEVWNTDAEGRLILADALAYVVDQYNPDKIINSATLTGACIVALGHLAAGIMGTSDEIMSQLEASAERTGDRVWPLPLWDDYCDMIKGQDADICNMNPQKNSGTITAGAFLKHFVGETPWVHVDIAGTSWGVQGVSHLNPKLATGYGVRLFTDWVLSQA